MVINVCIVAQNGRLKYEAALFALSFAATQKPNGARLHICMPQQSELWNKDISIDDDLWLRMMEQYGVTLHHFDNSFFGEAYPHSNKAYAIGCLPEREPFVFFDTDVIILDDLQTVPFDFDMPSAKNEDKTWPRQFSEGPTLAEIWGSLYQKFDRSTDTWFRKSAPETEYRHYPYFNAGCLYYRDPKEFSKKYLSIMEAIWTDPPSELSRQTLFPWLDQISLPLLLQELGGNPDTFPIRHIDRSHSFHYHALPILFLPKQAKKLTLTKSLLEQAGEDARKLFTQYAPFEKILFGDVGKEIELIVNSTDFQGNRKKYRQVLASKGLWFR